MKNLLFGLILFSLSAPYLAKAQKENPKIVVGIIVDQMRQEYIHRFRHQFTEGGFNRILNDGFAFRNAHYNYVPTYTAPGHASVYTGTTPSDHGIIANNWYSKQKDRSVYCVSDPSCSAIGGTAMNGKISPRNLISSTITDELRVFSNFRSKVIGISIKDRGAVLPAGHNPTAAFWMDSKTAEFMSSDYYFNELPGWVQEFNNKKLASKYLSQVWNTLNPIETYIESTEDNNAYERNFKGKETPTFPYNLKKLVKDEGVGLIRSTPFGNTIVLDFGLEAIEKEALGADDITDFLALSFSSTDYIGHGFGPNSIELQDTYLRLDLEIKRLLDFLDERFGNDYLIFLSADHGVANVPQFQIDNKLPGGYVDEKAAMKQVGELIEKEFGEGDWVLDVSNDQIFLDKELIKSKGLELTNVQEKIQSIVLSLDVVHQAYTANELAKRNGQDQYRRLLENGFNTQMSGDVLIRLLPGHINGSYGKEGTTHGSGNTNDTHVPILFFGKDIPSGNSVRKVSITDIAPTLSMLLNIPLPSNATGTPLLELFD